ncbi:hypothetical protein CSA80_03860 [Candidatus Saccharibacteria bacterium]|nr:MAG: hypothetical protein CSA80_03860 [Candidatus Saccharibacteria bacterium]
MSIAARRLVRSSGDKFILGVTVPEPNVNVGVYPTVARTAYTGPTTITTPGTVVEDKDITQYITVNAPDVTFRNCYFSAGGDLNHGGMVDCKTANCSNIRFYRCTFIPSTCSDRRDAVYGHDYTIERCHIEHTVDGLAVVNQHAAAVNVRVLGNWIGNLSWYADDRGAHADGTHNDCIQMHSGTGLEVVGNAFYGYKYNVLGTPALDGSADNRHPQVGQIILTQTAAYYHVGDIHVRNNFIWGGANCLKYASRCAISGHNHRYGYDVENVNNIWMDDNQRDYGYTWHFYPIRTDDEMTINGIGPFATSGATYDVHGNHWSATSPGVTDPARKGQPVFIRCDAT